MIRLIKVNEIDFDWFASFSVSSPQYLRKRFFPRQKLLEYAGLLNPLDAPHHSCTNQYWFYREGVTLPSRPVDVGLHETKIQIHKRLQQDLRVTILRTDITKESQNKLF